MKHRGGWWEQVFNTRTEQKKEELGLAEYDNILRCLYTPGGERAGWVGKSILHEAIGLLMTAGVVFADRALTNKNDFNGELANAMLCVVEEKNISLAGATAYNRIKEWVTGRNISIRKMRTDSYSQPNTTHWVQCANNQNACPIFPGDTRITMIYVPDLVEEIPKKILLAKLEEESPHFMRTLMDLQLPPVAGRLRLPVVTTDHKQQAERLTRNALEEFLAEHCHEVPGVKILFAELYEAFHKWLPPTERHEWSRIRTSCTMPTRFPVGAGTDNKKFIGNLAWEKPGTLPPDGKRYIRIDGKLRLEDN